MQAIFADWLSANSEYATEMALGDICSKVTDGSHFSPKDDSTSSIPMLSVKDMREFDFDLTSCKHICEDDYDKMVVNDCVPQVNDILVAKDGSYLKEIFICNEQRKLAILSRKFMNKTLTHSMKSYITIFWVGILVGCICRLTDYCPADTLWSFSSIQTLLGFWIITNTIIVLASTSNICAGISSFLYMFGMTLSFYGLQAILGTFIPLFSGGFRTSLFILFTICSIPCAIAAFILYYWNKEHIFNSILYSLPVGALAAEAIVIFIYFLGHHTFLFQLLMDVIGVLIFLFMFYKKAKSKKLFLIASVISALVFYFVFPW